jgi:para-nitrobenzyl esterase
VYHGSEVAYVFQDPSGSSERTKSMMSAIGSYWTQMAKTGSPNGEGLVHWPAFTKENDLHLKLDENITVESGLRKKTCDFWDSLPKESPY